MSKTTRKAYLSDLTDAQWNIIALLIPPKVGRGEDRKVDLREVVNGILYVLRTGCQWAYLPHALELILLAKRYHLLLLREMDKGWNVG